MMKKIFLIVILFSHINLCFSQIEINGILRDSESQEAISYAHIGVKNKNIGTISKEDGSFKLVSINDSLQLPVEVWFSCIGYKTKFVRVDKSNYNNLIVTLEKQSFELDEVVIGVKSKSKLKSSKLGGFKKSKFTTGNANTSNYGKGEEYGIKIKTNGNNYRIKSINFHTKYNSMDSVLFRLNLYKLSEDGFPEKSLLNEQLFVKSYKNQKWISKNLEDVHLYIDEDIVVSIEPIKFWYDNEKYIELFYTHCKKCGDSFHKASSFSKWEKNKMPAFAIYLEVESEE